MNKCEEQGFKHAWLDSTPNIVYTTNPPQSPDRQETCINCHLIRYHREKTERWIEYSDGQEHQDSYGDRSTLKIMGEVNPPLKLKE